jgi:hypothetical protein
VILSFQGIVKTILNVSLSIHLKDTDEFSEVSVPVDGLAIWYRTSM